jgi:hypothetical protein
VIGEAHARSSRKESVTTVSRVISSQKSITKLVEPVCLATDL